MVNTCTVANRNISTGNTVAHKRYGATAQTGFVATCVLIKAVVGTLLGTDFKKENKKV